MQFPAQAYLERIEASAKEANAVRDTLHNSPESIDHERWIQDEGFFHRRREIQLSQLNKVLNNLHPS